MKVETNVPSNDTADDSESLNMLGIQHSKSTGSLNVAQNVQSTPAKLSLPPVTAQGEITILDILLYSRVPLELNYRMINQFCMIRLLYSVLTNIFYEAINIYFRLVHVYGT